jgi:hypothetical protein
MGQGYSIINLDRKEYINPYKMGEGNKLLGLDRMVVER